MFYNLYAKLVNYWLSNDLVGIANYSRTASREKTRAFSLTLEIAGKVL
jgi:hypothetical protein